MCYKTNMKSILFVLCAVMILFVGCSAKSDKQNFVDSKPNEEELELPNDGVESDDEKLLVEVISNLIEIETYATMEIYIENGELAFDLDGVENKNEIIEIARQIDGHYEEIEQGALQPGFATGYNLLVEQLDERLFYHYHLAKKSA